MFDMNNEIIKYGFIVCASMATGLLLYSLGRIQRSVPRDSREYMDPLPQSLKILWPMVRFFAFYIGERLSADILEQYNIKLRRSGIAYLMTAEQYFGLKVLSLLLSGGVAYLCISMLQSNSWFLLIGAAAVGWFMPDISLNDLCKKRRDNLVKQLPVYLDFLTMAVQSGMNLSGAIFQAVDKGPEGPLMHELAKVLRDIKAGMSRIDAIRAMGERVSVKELNSFVTATVQAEKTGASLGETLKAQSDQRRIERFQTAEKKAMQAPVKLIFPLVAFIFPMTFVIIGFPIAMKFLYEM